MTDRNDSTREVLRHLVPAVVGANDWPDVVRRADRRRALSFARLRRPMLALLAALSVTVPALAATGTIQALWRHRVPAITVAAQLRDSSGARAGSFQAELPGAFTSHDRGRHLLPHRFVHRGGLLRTVDSYSLHWRVELAGGAALNGQIVYRPGVAHAGRTVADLCRPCAANASGKVALTRTEASLLVNGQLALRLQTRNGTLSGVVPRVTQNDLIRRPRRP